MLRKCGQLIESRTLVNLANGHVHQLDRYAMPSELSSARQEPRMSQAWRWPVGSDRQQRRAIRGNSWGETRTPDLTIMSAIQGDSDEPEEQGKPCKLNDSGPNPMQLDFGL